MSDTRTVEAVTDALLGVPAAVREAFDHVRSVFPDVTIVEFENDNSYSYRTDTGHYPRFGYQIDYDILDNGYEAALDAGLVPGEYRLAHS